MILASGGDAGRSFLQSDDEDGLHPAEFKLVESVCGDVQSQLLNTPTVYSSVIMGMDDIADPFVNDGPNHVAGDLERHTFSASPVLISCLRDISRMTNSKVN